MEKMKEVKKGSGVDKLDCFVGIFEWYKARPIEKAVLLVRERIESWIVALAYVWRFVELKLVLKMNSRDDVKLKRSGIVKIQRRVCRDIGQTEDLVHEDHTTTIIA